LSIKSKKYEGTGDPVFESVGALHIHSTYSDGTGTVQEVAGYAARHKLEWIIITDHEHLIAKDQGEEGFYSSVCVLVGSELGDEKHHNHYLAFGIDKIPNSSDPGVIVQSVRDQGGFGAIAHPHEKRDVFKDMPPYPWTAWDVRIDGIEIWNQLSQWVEGLTRINRIHHFLHPLKSLTRPDPETLAVWDRLNLDHQVIGFVGVDAHAMRYPLFGGLIHIKVFHYKVQFRSLRTHLLLSSPLDKENLTNAEDQVLTALRTGRHFGANHRLGKADGFIFYSVVNGQRVLPADCIEPGNPVRFVVHTPLDAEIILLCNGREVVKTQGRSLEHTSDQEGVWRVEAHRKRRGWIYSNSIRVLKEAH